MGLVLSSHATTLTIASAANTLFYRLAGLLGALRGFKISREGLDLPSTGVGRKVVPHVMSVLPVVRPLLKAAAVVSDCALRILTSQEHVVIRIRNPTSAWA